MPKVKIVTSFGPGGWEAYAERFVKSFIKYWPAEHFDLEVCYHDQEAKGYWSKAPNVTYRNLNTTDEEHDKFMEGAKAISQPSNYRLDAARFGHKVFAMTSTSLEGYDWLIWLDGDTETFDQVPAAEMGDLLQGSDFVYMDRNYPGLPYPETSFIAFNLNSPRALSLLRDIRLTYVNGELFHYREWHDGFLIGRLVKLHEAHGLDAHSISKRIDVRDSFDNSPLSEWMMHLKGPVKSMDVLSTGMRYDVLVDLINQYKPKNIAEVGTWKGERAIQMAQAALKHQDEVHYTGFDLFEDGTEESDAAEMNTKVRYKVVAVEARLRGFADIASRSGKKFTFELVKGNTNQTLKGRDLSGVEFVFLDGGHSPATVRNDYEAFKHVPVVVFDDFFKPDAEGKVPPAEHCGTNELLKEIPHKVLPGEDPVFGGGYTSMALVLNDPKLKMPDFVRPLKVNPKDCVPQDHIVKNIEANEKLIQEWLQPCATHGGKALIVSGGPSLWRYMGRIKSQVAKGAKVFCVKHSYPKLIEAGIDPFACVILDPRPIDGVSTHGVNRRDLFSKVSPTTVHFVATMSDPGVTQVLVDAGARVMGWYAYAQVSRERKLSEGQHWITGGTCAAFRAISIAHFLGFRKLELYGFDLYVPEGQVTDDAKDEFGRPKYLRVAIGKGNKQFWSTGELISAAQDFEKLIKQLNDVGLKIKIFGKGICKEIWKDVQHKPLPSFRSLYG